MNSTRQAQRSLPEWAWVLWLLFLCLFAVSPLMLPGYHWGAHDARHSVYFLLEFDRAIQDGVLYPRWAPDFTFGYGYPFFNIYGPLSSYLGELFHLLGFDLVTSVEIVFGISAVASALAMYLWLRLYSEPPGAMLGALLYLYAPYHLVDIYVRASLAETVALAFLPLCLWAFARLLRRPTAARVAVAALCYAGLVFTSNPLALLFSPILGSYVLLICLVRMRDVQPWNQISRQSSASAIGHLGHLLAPSASAVLFGLSLSAVFWLPALLEYRYVRTDQWVGGYYDYRNHFVEPFQLFRTDWGFGFSVAGPDDGMSFQLGMAPVVLACLGLASWAKLSRTWRLRSTYFLIVTLAILFLMSPQSDPIWETIGLVRFAQFPWRLLALTVLSLAYVGASAFSHWRNDLSSGGPAMVWSTLIILAVYPYLRAEIRPPAEGEVSLQGLMRFQQSADEMTGSTIWVQEIPHWSSLADTIMSGVPITTKVDYVAAYSTGRLAVHSMAMGTTYEKVWFQAEDDHQRIRFHTFYYPGWRAYILDESSEKVAAVAPVEPEGKLGLITVPVPRGRHILLLRFEDTPVRKAGWLLTGFGALACLGLGLSRLGGKP